MPTTVTLADPLQTGQWDTVGQVWADGGGGDPNVTTTVQGWYIYDTLALDNQLVTQVDFNFHSNGFAGLFIAEAYVWNGPLGALFGATPPLGTSRYVQRDTNNSFPFIADGSDEVVGNFQFDLHNNNGQPTLWLNSLRTGRVLTGAGQKLWAVGLQLASNSPSVFWGEAGFRNITLTVQPMFTGLVGEADARGRADECPVCGRKSTRDTWVRSGYLDMMVCPPCYDEEDLVGRHYQGLGSERPGQGEG